MKSFFKRIKPYLAPIIITLVALILFHVVFMLGYVPSDSMEPTLEAGSLILGLRLHGELEKEDIIIFIHLSYHKTVKKRSKATRNRAAFLHQIQDTIFSCRRYIRTRLALCRTTMRTENATRASTTGIDAPVSHANTTMATDERMLDNAMILVHFSTNRNTAKEH